MEQQAPSPLRRFLRGSCTMRAPRSPCLGAETGGNTQIAQPVVLPRCLPCALCGEHSGSKGSACHLGGAGGTGPPATPPAQRVRSALGGSWPWSPTPAVLTAPARTLRPDASGEAPRCHGAPTPAQRCGYSPRTPAPAPPSLALPASYDSGASPVPRTKRKRVLVRGGSGPSASSPGAPPCRAASFGAWDPTCRPTCRPTWLRRSWPRPLRLRTRQSPHPQLVLLSQAESQACRLTLTCAVIRVSSVCPAHCFPEGRHPDFPGPCLIARRGPDTARR